MRVLGAVDIGGTKIAIGVARADGTLLNQRRIPTADPAGPGSTIARIVAGLRDGLKEAGGVVELGGIGVGCCGPLDSRAGLVLSPPNMPGWDRVPLVAELHRAFSVPVALENDCNAAALGELLFGAGQGVKDLLYVTLSTGIGAGIIVDGHLHRGVRDGAGEIGHISVDPKGAPCPCGSRGCLELLASGTGIGKRARAQARDDGDLIRRAGSREAVSAVHVVDSAAASGEGLAIWNETLDVLAYGLGNTITTLAPDRVLLGGGVSTAGEELLFKPLRERLKQWVRMVPVEMIDVRPAKFLENAGLLGAVAVAAQLVRR